jgi:hypothetical protein
MSISKYLLAAALSFCALGSLSAADSAKHAKKHYLDEQAISVTKDGIVVETKSGPIRVKALRSNSNGIYIYKQDVCEEATKDQKYCLNCRMWMTSRQYYSHLPCAGRGR